MSRNRSSFRRRIFSPQTSFYHVPFSSSHHRRLSVVLVTAATILLCIVVRIFSVYILSDVAVSAVSYAVLETIIFFSSFISIEVLVYFLSSVFAMVASHVFLWRGLCHLIAYCTQRHPLCPSLCRGVLHIFSGATTEAKPYAL